MRGSRKSREQHIMDGTYRDDRHKGTEVGYRLNDLEPTRELKQVAFNFFCNLAEQMNESGLLKPEDMVHLTHLAENYEIMGEAKKEMDKGMTVTSPKGEVKVNPYVTIYYKANTAFLDICKILGIGPTARVKLMDARVTVEDDPDGGLNLD